MFSTLTDEERYQILSYLQTQTNIMDAMNHKRIEKNFRVIFREKIPRRTTLGIEWSDGERVFYSVDSPDFVYYDDDEEEKAFKRKDIPWLIESVQEEFPYSQTCVYIYTFEAPAGIFEATIYAKSKESLGRITNFLTKFPDRMDGEFRVQKASVSETTYEELEEELEDFDE